MTDELDPPRRLGPDPDSTDELDPPRRLGPDPDSTGDLDRVRRLGPDPDSTGDLDRVRRLRPDLVLPDDPPDPEVLAREKARLMSAIAQPDTATETRRSPSIYPRLAYRDEVAALDFLTRAFGLTERREARMEHPDGMLAWLELGDGVVMIGRAGEKHHGLHSPADTGAATAMVNVYVDDIDSHYQRATTAGARIVMELEDMFWGDRRYEALDPEGHRWHFAERLADIRSRDDTRLRPG